MKGWSALLAWAGVCAVAMGGSPGQFRVLFAPTSNLATITWAVTPQLPPAIRNARCVFGLSASSMPYTSLETRVATYNNSFPACTWCTPWSGSVMSASVDLSLVLRSPGARDRVYYSCGDDASGFSAATSFLPRPTTPEAVEEVRIMAAGDWGTYAASAAVASALEARNRAAPFDMLAFWGDLAYSGGNQSINDDFGALFAPLTSQVPTLYSPGNHDGEFVYGNNISEPQTGAGESGVSYAARLDGPGPNVTFVSPWTGPMWSRAFYSSVDFGPVHVVSTAGVLNMGPGTEQWAWLEQDLAAADANRQNVPFVVVSNHFPIYCTLGDCFCNYTAGSNCGNVTEFGILAMTARLMKDVLEPLLLKYRVDVFHSGHEHSYERTFPVANFSVTSYNSSLYLDPVGTVHVMVGTGGAGPDSDWKPLGAPFTYFSASRSNTSDTTDAPYGWLETVAARAGSDTARAACSNSSTHHALQSTFYALADLPTVFDSFTICKSTQ
jgi:Calcineurin-like phosphoesterase